MHPDNPHILLADDDPDDVLLAREALEELGIIGSAANGNNAAGRLTSVADGIELLDYLNTHADSPVNAPDLILLDLNMPRMGGLQALSALKNNPRFARIPVVVLSTSRSDDDIGSVYRLGGNAYVSKASSFTDTLSQFGALHHFWFKTAELPERGRC